MEKEIELKLGGLAEPIEIQLNKQGYTLDKDAAKYEKLNNARTMLFLHSYLSDSENDKIASKICKNIFKDIKPKED